MAEIDERYKIDNNELFSVDRKGADVTFVDQEGKAKARTDNLGSLAAEFNPLRSGDVNIVNDYPWTMTVTKGRSDIPLIKLKEYRANETSIKRAALFFAAGGTFLNTSRNTDQTAGILDVYDEVFPRDNPTGWRYTFPFFSENNMEINTSPWESVDSIEGIIKEAVGQIFPSASKGIEYIEAAYTLRKKVTTGGVVNIFDRPKVFNGHTPRTIKVEFPLYNTIVPTEEEKNGSPWKRNKDFLFLFMNQNLFNKRDLTTGISPVFYEVLIPGQFYSVACSVTDFKVTNVGAIRMMYSDSGKPFIVPDVYQVSITLTELVMPSKNSFQASDSFEGYNRVISSGIIRNTEPSKDALGFVKKAGEVVNELTKTLEKVGNGASNVGQGVVNGVTNTVNAAGRILGL